MKALLVLLLCLPCAAQTANAQQSNLPSKEEISELMSKASEKVTAFKVALRIAKPDLDALDKSIEPKYLDAADTAEFTIKAIQKNGPTAYTLVSLVSLLDDLSLDAATGSSQLAVSYIGKKLKGGSVRDTSLESVSILITAQTGCYDISELILHATLRYIAVEDKILESVLSK